MPSFDFWREVSSNRITPDRYCSTPGVPKRSWRYARRFSSVHSTFTDWKRFSQVPLDSSAARMPLPFATIAAAVFASSLLSMAVGNLLRGERAEVYGLCAAKRNLSIAYNLALRFGNQCVI